MAVAYTPQTVSDTALSSEISPTVPGTILNYVYCDINNVN